MTYALALLLACSLVASTLYEREARRHARSVAEAAARYDALRREAHVARQDAQTTREINATLQAQVKALTENSADLARRLVEAEFRGEGRA